MKKALCIGLNYAGTTYALRGCINDADNWAKFLGENGFNVSILAEAQATKTAILGAISRLIASLKAGDVGFISNSSHGTWVPDISGDEPDNRDEAMVPYDVGDDGSNLILDDELHAIFYDIPRGATVVFVSDSCHSGTVYRFMPSFHEGAGRVRFLPPSHFAKSTAMVAKVERAFSVTPRMRTDAQLPGLLYISGCRDVEYSSDTIINGIPCGAFTHFAIQAFRDTLMSNGTYRDAYTKIRQHLPSFEYQQTPQLSASMELRDRKIFS